MMCLWASWEKKCGDKNFLATLKSMKKERSRLRS